MSNLELLSVAALLQDQSEQSLMRGQVGIVVEVLFPSAVLVDFSDQEGNSYAI